MPMELGLQLVTVVSPDFSNADRKVLDDVVNAIDGVSLHVFIKDLERANPDRVISRNILKSTHFFSNFSFRDLSIRPTFHPDYIASGDYFQ